MLAFAIPGVSNIAAGAIAGGVIGLGLLWYLIKSFNQAEADKIELEANKNYNIAEQQAKAAESAESQAIKDAQKNAESAPNNDF